MGFFQHVRKEASNTVIISEILDSRTRNLIQVRVQPHDLRTVQGLSSVEFSSSLILHANTNAQLSGH